jgi:proteasome lid subunit RPN8/RPN11
MSPNDAAMGVPGLDGTTRERVYDHVFHATDREVGGVLVGQTGRLGGPPLVTDAIAAIEATEQSTTLTFTQDSWEHVHRTMATRFPQDQIVGWYHSHPGHGIFLSEQDLFIHRNFFGGPSQIAWVIDPVAGTEGVFGWRDGEIAEWYRRPTSWPGVTPRRHAVSPIPAPALAPPHARAAAADVAVAGAPPQAAAPVVRRGADDRRVLALLGLLLAGILIGFGLWEVGLRGDSGSPTAATTVVTQPVVRSATTTKPSSTPKPAPTVRVTTHHVKTHTGGTVKTYTVHDSSAIPPPLP